MRAADKVADVYTLHGTHVVASTAAGTLGVVDSREISLNLDSSLGTGLLAFSASDTADLTYGSYLSAFVVA